MARRETTTLILLPLQMANLGLGAIRVLAPFAARIFRIVFIDVKDTTALFVEHLRFYFVPADVHAFADANFCLRANRQCRENNN